MQQRITVNTPAWEACGGKVRSMQRNHLPSLFSGGIAEHRKSAPILSVETGECISHCIPEMSCILIGLASIGSSLMLHLTDDALLECWQLLPGQHLAEAEVWCQQQGRVQFKVSISPVHTHKQSLSSERVSRREEESSKTYLTDTGGWCCNFSPSQPICYSWSFSFNEYHGGNWSSLSTWAFARVAETRKKAKSRRGQKQGLHLPIWTSHLVPHLGPFSPVAPSLNQWWSFLSRNLLYYARNNIFSLLAKRVWWTKGNKSLLRKKDHWSSMWHSWPTLWITGVWKTIDLSTLQGTRALFDFTLQN